MQETKEKVSSLSRLHADKDTQSKLDTCVSTGHKLGHKSKTTQKCESNSLHVKPINHVLCKAKSVATTKLAMQSGQMVARLAILCNDCMFVSWVGWMNKMMDDCSPEISNEV